MSFLIYFGVMIVAAASALFGLDLLTAPLSNTPATQMTSTATPSKLAQREADKKQEVAAAARTDDRALTPVFPAAPGGSKDVRMVYPPTNATTGAAVRNPDEGRAPQSEQAPQTTAQPEQTKQAQAAPASHQTAAVEPQQQQPPQPVAAAPPPLPVTQAKAETPQVTPVTQPAVQKTANHCDVSACAAIYHSFRASDCTYQPFAGPRRVCEAMPVAQQRSAEYVSRPKAATDPHINRAARQSRKDAELRAVAQRVREMTSARDEYSSAREDNGDVDDDDAPMIGRRVIVIERSGGWR